MSGGQHGLGVENRPPSVSMAEVGGAGYGRPAVALLITTYCFQLSGNPAGHNRAGHVWRLGEGARPSALAMCRGRARREQWAARPVSASHQHYQPFQCLPAVHTHL